MLIGLFVVIGLSILILGHEAGHFFAAKFFRMRVDEFGIGFPPRAWGKKIGETIYSVNWLPFGGFVKIAGENDRLTGDLDKLEAIPLEEKKRYFYFQPVFNRSVVILAGVTVNFLLAWVLLTGVFMAGTESTLMIGEVQPNSPAAAAGLQPGDVVLDFQTSQEFIGYVNAHRGEEISIKVRRGGEDLSFNVVPRENIGPNEGPVGVAFHGVVQRGFFAAVVDAFWQTIDLARFTLFAFADLIRNLFRGAVPQDIVGLVGIFPIAQQVGQAGWAHLVQLIALISVNLAVINLLPFPALDGGRFVLLLIEAVKGSPIPRKAEAWINTVGFAFLLVLMVVLMVRDIIRL